MDFYCGIPDITILWRGEWADPELVLDGQTCDYYDLEESLWESYAEECRGKDVPADADRFPAWVEENAALAREFIPDMARNDRTYIVTETCPHCGNEIEMRWDTDERGIVNVIDFRPISPYKLPDERRGDRLQVKYKVVYYNAFCPVCGERLMLCDECHHSDNGECDYDAKKESAVCRCTANTTPNRKSGTAPASISIFKS